MAPGRPRALSRRRRPARRDSRRRRPPAPSAGGYRVVMFTYWVLPGTAHACGVALAVACAERCGQHEKYRKGAFSAGQINQHVYDLLTFWLVPSAQNIADAPTRPAKKAAQLAAMCEAGFCEVPWAWPGVCGKIQRLQRAWGPLPALPIL